MSVLISETTILDSVAIIEMLSPVAEFFFRDYSERQSVCITLEK